MDDTCKRSITSLSSPRNTSAGVVFQNQVHRGESRISDLASCRERGMRKLSPALRPCILIDPPPLRSPLSTQSYALDRTAPGSESICNILCHGRRERVMDKPPTVLPHRPFQTAGIPPPRGTPTRSRTSPFCDRCSTPKISDTSFSVTACHQGKVSVLQSRPVDQFLTACAIEELDQRSSSFPFSLEKERLLPPLFSFFLDIGNIFPRERSPAGERKPHIPSHASTSLKGWNPPSEKTGEMPYHFIRYSEIKICRSRTCPSPPNRSCGGKHIHVYVQDFLKSPCI